MKKVVVVIMSLVCLSIAVDVQADCTLSSDCNCNFSDVPESHPFYDDITGICELGITEGYSDCTFRPANNITRAAMAAFFTRAIDKVVQPQIKVFDNKDQYLGNFLRSEPGDSIEIFIPSLMKQAKISLITGLPVGYWHFFESDDCTGQPYTNPSAMFYVWENSGKYYTGVATIPIQITTKSYKSEETCHPFNTMYDLVPVNEITLPFTAPVALPMRLE